MSPGPTYDVFVSFAREDQDRAGEISDALGQMRYSVFFSNNVLLPDQPAAAVVNDGLTAATAVVVLWSRSAANAYWVELERQAARAAGKRLLFVQLDGWPVDVEPAPAADELLQDPVDLPAELRTRLGPPRRSIPAAVATVTREPRRDESGRNDGPPETQTFDVLLDALPAEQPRAATLAESLNHAGHRVCRLWEHSAATRWYLCRAAAGPSALVLLTGESGIPDGWTGHLDGQRRLDRLIVLEGEEAACPELPLLIRKAPKLRLSESQDLEGFIATAAPPLKRLLRFDLQAWEERARRMHPGLTATFALSQLRGRRQSLDGHGWLILLLVIACFVAWVPAIPSYLLIDTPPIQNEARSERHLVLALSGTTVLGLFVAYARSVMAGVAAIMVGGILGAIATPLAGMITDAGAVPGAVSLGGSLGALGAVYRNVPARRVVNIPSGGNVILPLGGVLFVVLLCVSAGAAVLEVGDLRSAPMPVRAAWGAGFGMLAAIIFSAIVYFDRRRVVRKRDTREAIREALLMSVFCAGVGTLAFGAAPADMQSMGNGLGIGTFAGIVVAAVFVFGQGVAEPRTRTPTRAALLTTLLVLTTVGGLLLFFPNVTHGHRIVPAATGAVILAHVLVRILQPPTAFRQVAGDHRRDDDDRTLRSAQERQSGRQV